MKNSFFCLAILTLFWIGCNGSKDDCPGSLQFYLPLQAYGIKDTLKLGDTLRVRLDIPDKLNEINSSNVYDFINYNFKLITYIVKIDSLPITADPADNFDWITEQGESQLKTDIFLVIPQYKNNVYQYEVAIIPRHKGLFVFGMNSVADRASPLENLTGPCSKKPVHVYMKLENDSNVNFEFLKLSPDPSQANTDRQRFDEYAGFCFFVRWMVRK